MAKARPDQAPLRLARDDAPDTWLVVGGRGAGKTRLGAEWVNGLVHGLSPFTRKDRRYRTIALVGETLADVREVMIDGPSGIRTVARGERPRFETTRRRLVWDATGAVAQMFSAEDPESLRGPQFEAAWLDELAKWRNAQTTFDMLQFGLRLGERPLQLITTTPRPLPLLKGLMANPRVWVTVYGDEGEAAVVDPADYEVDAASRPARLHFARRPAPERCFNGIEIDFAAGFGEAGTDVPDLLKRAVMMLVSHWYEFRGSFRAKDQPVHFPAGFDRLIAGYRTGRL